MSAPAILLVEDEATARRLTAQGLAHRGYQVTAVASAEEAAPLLHRPWDAVITDLRLPGRDGLSLLADLRQLHPHTPCIVVTSFADKERAIRALNLGADHLLEKPFGIATLASILEQRRHRAPSAPIPEDRLHLLPLDERERHIVQAVLRGSANKAIAQDLGLAEQTVKNHLSVIYQRLGIRSRNELMALLFSV